MPVNSELFRKIADVIEHNPDGYNQKKWGFGVHDNDAKACRHIPADQVHTCGTSHCIAGWAVALTPVDQRPAGEVSDAARELLGLGESEAHFLFAPNWSPKEGVTVPGELRRIAEQQSVFETATAGYRGTATAGDGGTATAGDGGTATAGDRGTATAGYWGTATAGYRGTATAGDGGTATAGDGGTATAGYRGTATAGDRGTATAGDGGTATAGDRGTATAGDRGTATAGYRGVIVVWRIVGGNRRPVVGAIGETLDADGVVLEARQPYRLNDDGKWVKAPKPESK